ncbi:hypothetical protein JQT66_08590 [Sulfitobacter mediterraneus]|uniref:DUF6638 family protein n=1 Tax=Sulfitobacter mediterraneus TaxID=83219 RepID=UPI0019336C9E|nr:DUF6638 family protein [Sulfitobacter mediterraneus]MBM1310221.1 hypothetical protein [Sulfitobacter mediterraneus]MBM1314105.1 hypothetical protein [Sulfitobacter mediterraneus]MBM1322465.1 hypothetical protein [Sulfitobacter mediterraneus]MBM1326377.1 hypothetical protein [Sulfitobacter mediterraneus]MBM1397723.1 hypothetical protein [Sulfitobacter mediterraneus]
MHRLIKHGLMFGNLFHVDSPALVERYNRALEHLTGKRTELSDFHIDISGYSPEVGDELDDHLYLNHAGVNRQFILLSMEQRSCPLLNTKFSTSREILQQFMDANEAQLFALTARDAVTGELVNSVYDVSTPARLFDIRRVEIEADTTGGTLRDAEKLGGLVDRFKSESDGWFDDVLIAEMITLAGKTGDVIRNPVKLKQMGFDQRNFWTAHFGGLYLFQDLDHPALIAPAGKDGLEDLPIKYVFDAGNRNQIAKFFDYNDLVEPIVKARGVDAAAILRQKMDFILVDAVADLGVDLSGANRADMRRLARHHGDKLPPEFHALGALVRWAENGGAWPRITSDHPAYFYTLRASDTKDAALVNMLLAELAPKDARQMFICHKELFYRTYAGWAETKKAYVADFLVAEYQVDKAGARAALFGHDAPMEEPRRAKPDPVSEMIARVGPWGAVRRR